jgi:hypothetical protein
LTNTTGAHLVGISEGALPSLNILLRAIGPGVVGLRSGFRSNVNALTGTVLHGDVVVVRDEQLLGGQSFISLPDVQGLTVGSEVGAKIDTIVGVRISVGRDADLGATSVVNPLLEWEVGVVCSEAVAARSAKSRWTSGTPSTAGQVSILTR